MGLILAPITLTDANKAIRRWHRHHNPTINSMFAVAVAVEGADEPCGVAVVGRPCARSLCDGWTAEVLRVATDGTYNACSMLYGAAWRACRALGYKRLITYTLPEEGGASLRASGFTLLGEAGGGNWSRKSRPRFSNHPQQIKFKWEKRA